jgi:uncharacterized membrane protein YdcZ (DUF606 family)
MEALAVPLLLAVGGLLALQAAANVQLSAATGSPFGAATIQLGIGATLLLTATAAAGAVGAFGLLGEAPGWHLVGGLASALYITSGILLFPRLGALLTVGLWITGQMLASLALDGFGWLGVAREIPGVAQVVGAAAVIVAVAVIVRTDGGRRERSGRASPGWRSPWWLVRRCRCRARSTLSCAATSTLRSRRERCRSWWRRRAWARSCSGRWRGRARRARSSSRCAASRGGAGWAAWWERPT